MLLKTMKQKSVLLHLIFMEFYDPKNVCLRFGEKNLNWPCLIFFNTIFFYWFIVLFIFRNLFFNLIYIMKKWNSIIKAKLKLCIFGRSYFSAPKTDLMEYFDAKRVETDTQFYGIQLHLVIKQPRFRSLSKIS